MSDTNFAFFLNVYNDTEINVKLDNIFIITRYNTAIDRKFDICTNN